jgi:hypothetical protein
MPNITNLMSITSIKTKRNFIFKKKVVLLLAQCKLREGLFIQETGTINM